MNGPCPDACAFAGGRSAFDLPVGQVRRIAALDPKSDEVDETKRNVLKLLGVAGLIAGGGGLIAGSIQYAQPPQIGASSYPDVQILDLDGAPLTVTKVMSEYNVESTELLLFNYPLRNEPNFLLNLASPPGKSDGTTNASGGIGPQNTIVAFSAICQHLGCPAPALGYYPPGACPNVVGGKSFYIHCSCHGSTYDVTNGASNLTGPAVLPLPQVVLFWNKSDDSIHATSVQGPTVNGHLSTLTGDYPVGSTTQLAKQQPIPPLCVFPS